MCKGSDILTIPKGIVNQSLFNKKNKAQNLLVELFKKKCQRVKVERGHTVSKMCLKAVMYLLFQKE